MRKSTRTLILRLWSSCRCSKITPRVTIISAVASASRATARTMATASTSSTAMCANARLAMLMTTARSISTSARTTSVRTSQHASMALPITRVLANKAGKDGCKSEYCDYIIHFCTNTKIRTYKIECLQHLKQFLFNHFYNNNMHDALNWLKIKKL